jgi:hypothetical protein
MANPDRKHWNQQQQVLQHLLTKGVDFPRAIELFLSQHAVLHASEMAQTGFATFEDEIWLGLSEAAARVIPKRAEHSIAWNFWHLARIEDVTMNLLVADTPQLFEADGWLRRLGVVDKDTGNAMSEQRIAEISAKVDLEALRSYRTAVGRRTREIVQGLQPGDLKKKVDPERLQRVLAEGAVEPAAMGLIKYWGGRTCAGLLLMPPTRHNFVHLNEALKLMQKIHLSPR